ncbi:histidine kinase dimerization/phosphoacceptor domain -containing protein [Acuticoccus kandeliae]|uniref:histidine kinase dimerization/phosphoacceptor domain -containing protein n=1 Tax=Acuticoccus kandeliae TaxID=2073160 RepID=UPI001474FA8B|nr:histidine kinase dimerization/phosphoacceptor domain -containing protein [Acuticoccus kandeliae]
MDELKVLDTAREAAFDSIVELIAAICEVPVALVSFVDSDRQWFKAEIGVGRSETPLEQSICQYAILEDGVVEIRDTLADPRSLHNPLCYDAPNLRFYAGAVLKTEAGVPVGTLCVLDTKPRTLNAVQRQALELLARQVMKELELRSALERQSVLQREMDHRVKNSLQSVASFVRLEGARAREEETRQTLSSVGRRISAVALLHQEIYSASVGDRIALESYMAKLASLFGAAAPSGVVVEVAFDPVLVNSAQATGLAAIVNEFVTNAFKHAFGENGGTVSIRGTVEDGVVRIAMRDDGVGLEALPEVAGLGLAIIEASAEQIGATLAFETGAPGFGLRLAFPVGPARVAAEAAPLPEPAIRRSDLHPLPG